MSRHCRLQASARIGAAAIALAAALCGAARAAGDEAPPAPPPDDELAEPGFDAAAPTFPPLRPERLEPRLWLEHDAAPFDLRTADLRPAPPTLMLGLGYRVGERSSLIVNTGLTTGLAGGPERRVRLGLAYEARARPSIAWAHGTLLRLQLDGGSSLSLRLRGGRVGLTWRAQF